MIKILMELLTAFLVFGSIQFIFASDAEKREELALYTSLFSLEVIATGLGTHLIKGKYFDIPTNDQHIIAIAAVKTWWTLPYMKRVADLVRRVGQSSAEEYLKSPPERSGRIHKYLFEKVDLQLKLDPKVNKIYEREKNNVSESGRLPKLFSGLIEVEDSINAPRKLQDAFISDPKLRIILINTVFQEYGFADILKKDKREVYELARAVVELSKRPEMNDRVNCIYRQAIDEIIAGEGDTLYEQSGADLVNDKLFPILMRSFKNDPVMNVELLAMKEYFAAGGKPPKD